MKKIQFGTDLNIPNNNNSGSKVLKYFLLESPVGFGYSKLKCYGIEIVRIDKKPGMRDISECKQIEGIFFDIEEAIGFLAKIKKETVLPTELSKTLEKFIYDKLKKQRELHRTDSIAN